MTAADHENAKREAIERIERIALSEPTNERDEALRESLAVLLSEHAAELARAQQEIETWRDRYREEHEKKLRLWNLSTQDMITVFGLRRKAILRAWRYRRERDELSEQLDWHIDKVRDLLNAERELVEARAENERLAKALDQACTNLAVHHGTREEGRSWGDDAELWKACLLAGWGGWRGYREEFGDVRMPSDEDDPALAAAQEPPAAKKCSWPDCDCEGDQQDGLCAVEPPADGGDRRG